MVESLEQQTSWKIILEPIIGNVVIPEVDAFMYSTGVVLSKEEKHMPYGKLVGATECTAINPRCCTNRGRYKRV